MRIEKCISTSGFVVVGKQILGTLRRTIIKPTSEWIDKLCSEENGCKSSTTNECRSDGCRSGDQPIHPVVSSPESGTDVDPESSQEIKDTENIGEQNIGEHLDPHECASQDNRPWFSFVEDLVRFQEELGMMVDKCTDSERCRLEYLYDKVGDLLERHDVTPIDGESFFAITRHQLFPPGMVPEGTRIAKTIRRGWCVGMRVLQRAIVEVDGRVR